MGCTTNDLNQKWQSTIGDFVNKNGATIALIGGEAAACAVGVFTVLSDRP